MIDPEILRAVKDFGTALGTGFGAAILIFWTQLRSGKKAEQRMSGAVTCQHCAHVAEEAKASAEPVE